MDNKKYKEIKKKQLAKRIIKNSDRSSCCNETLKTSKPGRVMCTKCNKFCKVVAKEITARNNKAMHYTAGLIWVSILAALVIAAYFLAE